MKKAAVSLGGADDGGRSRRATAPPPEDRRNASFNDNEIVGPGLGPDVPPYDHKGTVVVAGDWLAFYLTMVVSSAISLNPNQNQPASLAAQYRSGGLTTD
jgi:hypothetical protein